ncbi:MAG: cation diffusion facilitator family transporter [Scytolyngbya sp. HA4215-MV1]|jgi:cobalt-zinc-cadmium efflux system protein|nr:cation diffusion facilitator family transporter [Scytolyngbya sp. HA4215-MV1]
MFHRHSAECGCVPAEHSHKTRSLWIVLVLLTIFSLAELLVGISSHSLALLADMEHIVADGLMVGMALFATWLAGLPASAQATFGYRRAEVLAALLNGLGLVAIAGWIGWESIQAWQTPPEEIAGLPMLVTAAIGLGINSLNAWMLHQDSEHDLNMKAIFLHVLADALSSLGIIVAAIAVSWQHWLWADSVISFVVAGLIVVGTLPLIGQSLQILLEKPTDPSKVSEIQAFLEQQDSIQSIADLRLWTVALGQEVLCAHLHVNLTGGADRDRLLRSLQASLRKNFAIQDVIIQMSAPLLPEAVGFLQPELLEMISLSSDRTG